MNLDFSNYAALVMDWDGTVVDSQPLNYRCLAQALSPYGIDLHQRWYRARIGTSGADLLAELGVAAPHEEVLARCGELIISQVGTLRPFPVAVGWVEAARGQGLRCAVASGGGGPVVRAGLAATGLERLFEVVVTREDVARGKPAPDLFVEAARRLGVPPTRCLVVEDADEGLAAARAAGMDAVDVRPFAVSAW
ncbi:HAD family hydrolase [Streptomyces sp. NPDC021100]|uniref:HAD family hydrolase n=1 Tax=Streptomyces sp. NPDC021100 TaxID=3365114 RepID=UPI00378EAD9F